MKRILTLNTTHYTLNIAIALLAIASLTACNSSDDEAEPSQTTPTRLAVTVTSKDDPNYPDAEGMQCPAGNVYLFFCPDVRLDLVTVEGDGSINPLIDVSTAYSPVIHYQGKTIHPVSAYGSKTDGQLDSHSSVRYSTQQFNLGQLSKEYGTIQYNSDVLLLVALDNLNNHAWTTIPMALRGNYTLHITLPARRNQQYIGNSEKNAGWLQVEE